MPKRVDHNERRRQIAEALWRIAASRGLEAVSMREVAGEAGMSIGRVQHYFASKDEMVLFAAGRLRERIDQRIRESVAAAGTPSTPLRTLRAVLTALLPVDAESRTLSLVGIAVFIRALNEPALATTYERGRGLMTVAVAEQIRAASRDGELRPDLHAELEADALLALVGGLGSDLLLGHHAPERALRILDEQLERLR